MRIHIAIKEDGELDAIPFNSSDDATKFCEAKPEYSVMEADLHDLASALSIFALPIPPEAQSAADHRRHTVEAAREQYGSDDIEVDEDAIISEGEDGDFVQAWVWVPREEDGDD